MYCQGAADTEAQSCLHGKYKGVFISLAMAPMNKTLSTLFTLYTLLLASLRPQCSQFLKGTNGWHCRPSRGGDGAVCLWSGIILDAVIAPTTHLTHATVQEFGITSDFLKLSWQIEAKGLQKIN